MDVLETLIVMTKIFLLKKMDAVNEAKEPPELSRVSTTSKAPVVIIAGETESLEDTESAMIFQHNGRRRSP